MSASHALAHALFALSSIALAQNTTSTTNPAIEHTYRNDGIGFTLLYPADLQAEQSRSPEDPALKTALATQAMGRSAASPASPCASRLLELAFHHPISPGPQVSLTGSISLSDVNPACLPGGGKAADLIHLVTSVATRPGAPINPARPPQHLSYDVDHHSIYLAVADSSPSSSTTSNRTFSAAIGAILNGHPLVWTVHSNNELLFNLLLKLRIQFDHDAPEPLVPFELHKLPQSAAPPPTVP